MARLHQTVPLDKGHKVQVYLEEEPVNPRDGECFSKMFLPHKELILGDVTEHKGPEDFHEFLEHVGNDIVLEPVYLMNSCGFLYIKNTAFIDGNNSGLLGFQYVMKDSVVKRYGEYSTESIRHAREVMADERMAYDKYLREQVFTFEIVNEEGKVLDRCYGFLGCDHYNSGLYEAAGVG